MNSTTNKRPSELEIGMVGPGYTVISEPAEQPDGSWCVQVIYTDGGRSMREWPNNEPTIPVA